MEHFDLSNVLVHPRLLQNLSRRPIHLLYPLNSIQKVQNTAPRTCTARQPFSIQYTTLNPCNPHSHSCNEAMQCRARAIAQPQRWIRPRWRIPLPSNGVKIRLQPADHDSASSNTSGPWKSRLMALHGSGMSCEVVWRGWRIVLPSSRRL